MKTGTLTAIGWVASVGFHAAVAAVLVGGMSHAAQKPRDTTVRMAIRQAPPPAPKPVAPPPEAAPKPRQAPAQKKVVKAAPPPSNAAPREAPREAPKPVFGLSANSVAAGGSGASMAVAVGNTLLAAPDRKFTPPQAVAPYAAPIEVRPPERKIVASARLGTMPVPRSIVKATYPETARRDGIEGNVLLRLTIDEQGRVVAVSLIRGVGHGLDELSVEAARKFVFDPATADGTPVATVIPFTYRWELVN
jgi:protein TonB